MKMKIIISRRTHPQRAERFRYEMNIFSITGEAQVENWVTFFPTAPGTSFCFCVQNSNSRNKYFKFKSLFRLLCQKPTHLTSMYVKIFTETNGDLKIQKKTCAPQVVCFFSLPLHATVLAQPWLTLAQTINKKSSTSREIHTYTCACEAEFSISLVEENSLLPFFPSLYPLLPT